MEHEEKGDNDISVVKYSPLQQEFRLHNFLHRYTEIMDQPPPHLRLLDYLSSSHFLAKKNKAQHTQGPDVKFTQAKSISTSEMGMARNQSASFFNERPHN